MGYSLKIGEAVMKVDTEYGGVWVDTDTMTLEAAPLNSSDDHSNQIDPSYTCFAKFCEETGLRDVFGDRDNGLLASHPGVRLLTLAHLEAFKAAPVPAEKYSAKRLAWLIWWAEWALANCKVPVFVNS